MKISKNAPRIKPRAPVTHVPPAYSAETCNIGRVKLAPDADVRVARMEKILRDKLRYSVSHKIYNAQLLVLEVVKGRIKVEDIPGFEPAW